MLALGRALMGNPKLLMLDDPSEGLNPLILRGLVEAIEKVGAEGMIILIADQNLKFARRRANYAAGAEFAQRREQFVDRVEIPISGAAARAMPRPRAKFLSTLRSGKMRRPAGARPRCGRKISVMYVIASDGSEGRRNVRAVLRVGKIAFPVAMFGGLLVWNWNSPVFCVLVHSCIVAPVTPKETPTVSPQGPQKSEDEGRPRTKQAEDFIEGSIKLIATGVTVGKRGFPGYPATLTFVIENKSGLGIRIAVKYGHYSIGPCFVREVSVSYLGGKRRYVAPRVSGVKALQPDELVELRRLPSPADELELIPAHGRAAGVVEILNNDCHSEMLSGLTAVDVSVPIVLAGKNGIVEMVLTVEKVAVRNLGYVNE